MAETMGFDLRWRPSANLQRLQHYDQLPMSKWNNVNCKPIKSYRWKRANRIKIIWDRCQNSEGLIEPIQPRSRKIGFEVSLSSSKVLVNLIFKIGLFVLGCLHTTLFRHLLLRLFNYTCLLIPTSQIPILDLKPMCLSSGFKRLFLNELSLRTRILRVKSSEVFYYLDLKTKEDRVLER